MNYAALKKCDIANGIGIRVSLFVSGCTHHCKNCFNPEAWDFSYGELFTDAVRNEILSAMSPNYIHGLTLLGGEPLEPCNQAALLPFLETVHSRYPQKTIWCYTGYVLEPDLLAMHGRARCAETDRILSLLDVLVDGPFIEAQKNIRLAFRGSENQRLIDIRKTLKAGHCVLWEQS